MGELLRGVYVLADGRKRDQLFRLYHDVLTRMEGILPVTPQAAERFAEIDAMLRRKGRPIPVNDVWVAAVALSEDAVLVTADAHFSHVDLLPTENWAA
jgi:tRNA(fMet)-specific endonuclease VapC